MEEAISVTPGPIEIALARSIEPGEEFVPIELLATIDPGSDTTSAFANNGRFHAYFEHVQRDLGFLQDHRITRNAIRSEDQARLNGLMRWLRREFRDWNLAADSNCHTLTRMFVVTAFCCQYGDFWHAFAAIDNVNPEIIAELSRRTAHLQATLNPSERTCSPISDKRTLDLFNAADRSGDWATLASEWPQLEGFLFPDAFLSQSASYLHTFAPTELATAIEQLRQIVPVMLLLSSLPVMDSLNIGVASTNPYVQVGSILRLLQEQHSRNATISSAEADLLTWLFEGIARDRDLWARVMTAFNHYPTRYPQLQKSLGKALTRIPDDLLADYVNAINLTTTGIGRSIVAECLGAFRSTASLDRRKKFWAMAHERWLQWRFGKNDPTEAMMRIGTSDLDYALVGYALECMSAEQLAQRCTMLSTELLELGEHWHSSEVAFIEATSRILSTFQPYAYAHRISPNDEWLAKEASYVLPFDPDKDRYAAMFYQFNYVIPGLLARKT
ncbi:MAG: hypothetical protein ACYCSN_08565 [Acidobacteriaceae bacterium]